MNQWPLFGEPHVQTPYGDKAFLVNVWCFWEPDLYISILS